jgi:quinohemoprotein ethanol dehydrogenase
MLRICLSLIVLAALVPQMGVGQETFSAQALVDLPRDGWRMNGGNLYNQGYSPLSQINRENISELKGVWQARLRGSGVGTKYSGDRRA